MENRVEKYVIVGRVVGVFGVQGWVKIESYTDPRSNIFEYKPWRISGSTGPVDIAAVTGKAQGKGLIAQLDGIQERDSAVGLIGSQISIRRDQLPEGDEREFYWVDLIGLQVQTLEGEQLGRVDHLLATGANDVLVVEGDRQRLIPFVTDQVVKAVDLDKGLVTVAWDPDF